MWVVWGSIGSRPHYMSVADDVAGKETCNRIGFVLSQSADCALPVNIEKTQQCVVTHISARQLFKRISESVFGFTAQCYTADTLSRLVVRSHNIIINLETYDIGFPFSAFW